MNAIRGISEIYFAWGEPLGESLEGRIHRFCMNLFALIGFVGICIGHDVLHTYEIISRTKLVDVVLFTMLFFVVYRMFFLGRGQSELQKDIHAARQGIVQPDDCSEFASFSSTSFSAVSLCSYQQHVCLTLQEGETYQLVGLGMRGLYRTTLRIRHLVDRTMVPFRIEKFVLPEMDADLLSKVTEVFRESIVKMLNKSFQAKPPRAHGSSAHDFNFGLEPLSLVPAGLALYGVTHFPFRLWDPERPHLGSGKSQFCSEYVYRILHAACVELNGYFASSSLPQRVHLPGEGTLILSGLIPKVFWKLLA